VLTGRLGRSRVYEAAAAERVLVSAAGEGPLPFARDGEVEVPVRSLLATVHPACLVVYRAPGADEPTFRGASPGAAQVRQPRSVRLAAPNPGGGPGGGSERGAG
jgi:hypothetical protein